MFKTATLVYKYLHTGFPRYVAQYLYSYSSCYSTRHSQSAGNFLVIPNFYSSVHKSVKQFDDNFAFHVPTVWNALPDEICASPSLASFRKHLKNLPVLWSIPSLPWIIPLVFSVVLDPSHVSGYWKFVDCFLFCCALESSCMGRLSSKSAIRIRIHDVVEGGCNIKVCTKSISQKYIILKK